MLAGIGLLIFASQFHIVVNRKKLSRLRHQRLCNRHGKMGFAVAFICAILKRLLPKRFATAISSAPGPKSGCCSDDHLGAVVAAAKPSCLSPMSQPTSNRPPTSKISHAMDNSVSALPVLSSLGPQDCHHSSAYLREILFGEGFFLKEAL
jgi:hypothetical protein